MAEIDPNVHPGLYRYSIELLEYPVLTDSQYEAMMSDLARPGSEKHTAALDKLICHHLGMVLAMAKHHNLPYPISMEDYVGLGNMALVERANRFHPNKKARFSTYMRTVVRRWVLGGIKKHIIWYQDESIEDIELVGANDPPETNRYEHVRQAIATLTEFEQQVVHYTFFDNFGADEKEIAKTLHVTLYRLRYTKKRIYEKLRPLLEKKHYEQPGGIYRIGESEAILEPEDMNERNH